MGPNRRADVRTVLEEDADVGVAEAARRAGCSFATAWQVVQDFRLLRSVLSRSTPTSGSTGRRSRQGPDPPLRHSHKATKVITPASTATRSHCLGTIPSTMSPRMRAASAPVMK